MALLKKMAFCSTVAAGGNWTSKTSESAAEMGSFAAVRVLSTSIRNPQGHLAVALVKAEIAFGAAIQHSTTCHQSRSEEGPWGCVSEGPLGRVFSK
jgi:hypothetical protein